MLEPLFREKTGLVLDAYFSGTKLAWLLDNVPGARARARAGELAFGTVDSWLVWNLTGGSATCTDVSNASRTLLFNIHTGAWDDDLLAASAHPTPPCCRKCAPPARSMAKPAPTSSAARIPIAGIAGDQQAALFGQVCFAPGMVKNTYGTGCFMLMNTGCQPGRLRATGSYHRRLADGGATEYALEGSVFIAGAAVQWLRDGLGIIKNSAEVEALAASVAGQRRGLSGPGLRRSGRAPLGPVRPWHRFLYRQLHSFVERALPRLRRENKGWSATALRYAYLDGAVTRIGEKFREQTKIIRAAERRACKDLVVLKDQIINNYMAATYPNIRLEYGRKRIVSSGAFDKGYCDAGTINLRPGSTNKNSEKLGHHCVAKGAHLVEKRTGRENRIEIRNPSGRLLRIETVRLMSGTFSSLPIHKFGQKGIHHVLSSF